MTFHTLIRFGGATLLAAAVIAGSALELRPSAQAARPAASGNAALIARGDYLTHKVAMCVECHSPRDARGTITPGQEFTGAPIPVSAPSWAPDWAMRAPAIAGLPGMTDEQVMALLMTGRGTGRDLPRRPMPPFRLSNDDAAAIVAYLRTK